MPWAPTSDVNLRSAPGSESVKLPRIQGWAMQIASSQWSLHDWRFNVRSRPSVGVPVVGPGRCLGSTDPLPPVREGDRRRRRRPAERALVGSAGGGGEGDPVVFSNGRRGTLAIFGERETRLDLATLPRRSAPEPGLAGGQSRRCRSIRVRIRPSRGDPERLSGAWSTPGSSGRCSPTAIEGHLDVFDAVSGDPVWTGTVPISRAGSSAHRPWPVGGSSSTTSSSAASGKDVSGGSRPWTPPPVSRGWIGEWVGGYNRLQLGRSERQVRVPGGSARRGKGRVCSARSMPAANRNYARTYPEGKACRAVWSGSIGAVTTVESLSGGLRRRRLRRLRRQQALRLRRRRLRRGHLRTAVDGSHRGDIDPPPPGQRLVYVGSEDDNCTPSTPTLRAATSDRSGLPPYREQRRLHPNRGLAQRNVVSNVRFNRTTTTCTPSPPAAAAQRPADRSGPPPPAATSTPRHALGNRMVYVGSADGQL